MGSHSLELIMNGLVVLAACVCASSAQLIARAVLPTHQAHQFHAQDEFGQFSFGHAGGPSARTESRDAYGVTTGSYQYLDAFGLIQTVNYISDAAGFRVVGTNLPAGPAAVAETPEVAAARAEHLAAVEAAAAAAAAAPEEVVEVVAVEEAAPAEVVAERKKRQAILPALAYNGLPAAVGYNGLHAVGYNGLLAPYPLAAHGLLAGTPAEIVADVELPVATVKAAEAVEAPVVAAAAPVAAALPLAGAYALPAAPAVAAREATLTEIKLNPGHATFYRVD